MEAMMSFTLETIKTIQKWLESPCTAPLDFERVLKQVLELKMIETGRRVRDTSNLTGDVIPWCPTT
jgi:hypothetical protein